VGGVANLIVFVYFLLTGCRNLVCLLLLRMAVAMVFCWQALVNIMYRSDRDSIEVNDDVVDRPWRKAALIIFRARPTQPIMSISLTLSTGRMARNRSIDWKKMLIPRARRKTPLKKAPSIWARCQPNESH